MSYDIRFNNREFRVKRYPSQLDFRYLRHLNLSHNKITRFENLNHTKITDLNIEHNLISSFESGNDVGVKTMLSLNSLSLGNNLISELDFLSVTRDFPDRLPGRFRYLTLVPFQGCYHLKKLELQNNRVESLLELSNLRSVRKINLLDLTGNPVCENKSYRNLMLHAVPDVKYLDHSKVHLSEKVTDLLLVLNQTGSGVYFCRFENSGRHVFGNASTDKNQGIEEQLEDDADGLSEREPAESRHNPDRSGHLPVRDPRRTLRLRQKANRFETGPHVSG